MNMDVIYKQLYAISEALVSAIKTRHIKMADMLVPVSMAMLTDYDEAYFGLLDQETAGGDENGGTDE